MDRELHWLPVLMRSDRQKFADHAPLELDDIPNSQPRPLKDGSECFDPFPILLSINPFDRK